MTEPNKERPTRRPWLINFPLITLLLIVGASAFWYYNSEPAGITLTYGELMQVLETKDNNVRFENVKVGVSDIRGKIITTDEISDGTETKSVEEEKNFRTPRVGLERDTEALVQLLKQRVGSEFQGEEEESVMRGLLSLLMSFLFIFMFLFGGFILLRWALGTNSPLTFGRSRHKLYAEKDVKTTFEDVAGADEAVEELREIVDFLKNPNRYQILGGRIPKGVLLVGPPGTGKTLLARAVAGEADVAFFGMSGSDFVEMFVGVGASRVRDLFSQAETRAPCIIFIDELDALGKARGYGSVGGHDEREQTLNQLLVEMDGFESNRGLILVAATNRPETLDPALLRPGRFDRTVVVDRPDLSGREEILKVHTRDVKLADDVDLRQVASMTPGSVGADLENIVNEAALLAARKNGNAVSMPDFNEAVERTLLGLERKSRIMTKEEKLRTAYHEAGHALVACSLPNSDPVHKVTIIPRGMAGGYVLSLPEEERFSQTKSELETIIRYCLGGTIAEEIIFNEIANGATSDLQKANHIAQLMVKNYGMSPLGRIFYTDSKASFLPGISIPNGDNQYSEETAREIDLQVRSIIDEAIEDVRNLLTTRRDALSAVAERLIEKETIDGSELRKLLEDFDFDPKVLDKTVAVDEKPNARE